MTAPPPKRLSRVDWIDHGIEVLKTKGHTGLKADVMARDLGVSRGSFYWHFENLDAFHAALLDCWRANITETVIGELKSLPTGPAQLRDLFRRVLQTPQVLERAVRHWGTANRPVSDAVARVDDIRRAYVRDLLIGHGLPERDAEARVTLMYLAYVGRVMLPTDAVTLDPAAAAALADLFFKPELP